jgi:hypothetical protein
MTRREHPVWVLISEERIVEASIKRDLRRAARVDHGGPTGANSQYQIGEGRRNPEQKGQL